MTVDTIILVTIPKSYVVDVVGPKQFTVIHPWDVESKCQENTTIEKTHDVFSLAN